MTALCGGGASEPLPLVQPVVQLTAAIAEVIAASFGLPEMGYPLSLAVAGMSIATVEVCGTDPPPDPGLTQVDVLDALNVLEPFVALPAQAKIKDWFLHRYWWNICQCSGVATPPPPVPSNPNTPVGIGTGSGSGINPQPCWSGSGSVASHSTAGQAIVALAPWLPVGPGSLLAAPGFLGGQVSLAPPGTTGLRWNFQPIPGYPHSQVVLHEIIAGQGTGGVGMQLLGDSADSSSWSGTRTFGIDDGAGYAIEITNVPGPVDPSSGGWSGTLSWVCADSPPSSIVQPCCPPDPLLSIKLDQLLGLVLDLYGRSSGGTRNYTKGPVHAGLSGSGSIPVSGRVGVLVDITAQATAPVLPGNPPYLFDQGWLSVLTPDGFIDEKRLTRTQQIWLPALFPISTSFGYFFNPGVTATVTELLPA